MNKSEYDIIIIGAGPAGMSAAILASDYGAKTLVLDEGSAPGGQIYRAIEKNKKSKPYLNSSYQSGFSLVDSFRLANVDYKSEARIWHLSDELKVCYSIKGKSFNVKGKQILVATGAQERPFPISGWTLSGVMGAGGAQVLLKESGLVCDNAVFVGSGPLLYLIAHQYLAAGVPIKAFIDTTPKSNYLRAIKHSFGALSAVKNIIEGWQWKREIMNSNTLYVVNVSDLRLNGDDSVSSIEYQQNGHWKQLDCEHVFLHQGVVPEVNVSLSAGCDKKWNEQQACWEIAVEQNTYSSIKGIHVAGDAASVSGAVAAEHKGSIAAINMLYELGLVSNEIKNKQLKPLHKKLNTELLPRAFLEALFKPQQQYCLPHEDDTIVCRCEEVSLSEIKKSVNLGCVGPNQLKSFTRCGMGPCQGRFCGLTVSELIAKHAKVPIEEVGYYRVRPPIKPVTLSELSCLEKA